MRILLRHLAALSLTLFVATGPCSTLPVAAQSASAGTALTGNVVDQQNGLAVAGAAVTLYHNTVRVASTTTDNSGHFAFPDEPAGLYDVEIAAVGYGRSRLTDEALGVGASLVSLRIVIARETSSQSGLREIGHVSARSNRNALATTTVVNRTISADLIQHEGNLRLGDALLTQSGLTSFNLDSAPGDDLNISIRGMRPSEAQTLIDGHPVGPIGVFNGNGGGFNYQLSPSSSLADVQIAYGTGAQPCWGSTQSRGRSTFKPCRLRRAACSA